MRLARVVRAGLGKERVKAMGSRARDGSARVGDMKPELSEVREAARQLSVEDREVLLEDMMASLDGVEPELD